ncbi:MAG: hypothetical protein KA105_02100 [Caulobacter sp.]|nr:hypothetical protein [Caulobacter sp.]
MESRDTDLFVGSYGMPLGRFSVADLKFGYFWFDRVIFDPLLVGRPSDDAFYNSLFSAEPDWGLRKKRTLWSDISDVVVPIDKVVGRPAYIEVLDECETKCPDFESPREDDPDPLRRAYSAGIDEAAREMHPAGFRLWDPGEEFGVARGRVTTVRLWQRLLEVGPTTFLPAPPEETQLQILAQNRASLGPASFPQLGRVLLPDVSSLSWLALSRIKRTVQLRALRAKVQEALTESGECLDGALNNLRTATEIIADVALEKMRPKPWRAIIKASLSNLPVPLANPFSIFESSYQIWSEYKAKEKYGWFYLLRDIQKGRRFDE